MAGTKQYGRSLVIQGYLNGKSMDQIVSETGVSKGKVHYLIKGWKDEIGVPDIDDLREFSVTVRKSGISIGQCAQGHRMISILKNLSIHEGDGDGGNGIGNTYEGNYNDFESFIEDTYKNCKREGVPPSIITAWIKDLFDFYRISLPNGTKGPSSPINGDSDGAADFVRVIGKGGYGNTPPKPTEARFGEYARQQQQQKQQNNGSSFSAQEDNDACGDGNPSPLKPIKENPENTNHRQNPQSSSSSPISEIEIPFVSKVSLYIGQKKKEYSKAREYENKIREEIGDLKFQKTLLEQELAKALKKEKDAISHLHMFSELKRVLLDGFGINIGEGIKELAKIIHDFQENGYDANKIIDEYTNSLSLKWQISENENKVRELQGQRNSLQRQVLSLESQAGMHRQTLSVYGDLQAMGFGITELKQIWNAILEIAAQNKRTFISNGDAVSAFIEDIEKNYHDKTMFDDKVKEKRSELLQTEQELNNNRLALQLTPFVGTTLQHLFKHGISENDIIRISQIVTEFANGKSQLISQGDGNKDSTNKDSTNKDNKAVNGINTNNNNNSNSNNRADYWKSFIENLRNLGNISSSIKEQQETHEKIKKETNELNRQKQDLSTQCQTAVYFIGLMAKHIHHFNWLIDYYYNTATKKVKTSSPTLSPLLINLIYVSMVNHHKDDKTKDEKI